MVQRTLVVVKPDGVSRGLVGSIIARFENSGLKIKGMKMVIVEENFAKEHYKLDEDWAKNVFIKTKTTHEKEGKEFLYKDHMEFGSLIQKWNMDFLREGPVVAIVLEGPGCIEIVRKIVGHTEPKQAAPGTIRGDFASVESYEVANAKKRVLRNLVHASDSVDNAEREIKLWFKDNEIVE